MMSLSNDETERNNFFCTNLRKLQSFDLFSFKRSSNIVLPLFKLLNCRYFILLFFVFTCSFLLQLFTGALPEIHNGGLGAKPPAAGGWGFGGKAPSRQRHKGVGAEPPALENFAFFCKNNFILGLFYLKIMHLKHGLEIGSASKIKLVA